MPLPMDQKKQLPASRLLFQIFTSYYTFILVVGFCVFSYFYLDQRIAWFMFHVVTGKTADIANILTDFGVSTYYIIILTIAFLVFQFILRKRKSAKAFLFVLLAVVIPGLLCDVLKVIAGRYRPTFYLGPGLYGFEFFKLHASMWSFPSGHSVTITGLMVALTLLFPRLRYIFCTMIFLVCSSRIMLYQHFLSDVVFAIYMSTFVVLILHEKFHRKNLL